MNIKNGLFDLINSQSLVKIYDKVKTKNNLIYNCLTHLFKIIATENKMPSITEELEFL